MNIWLPDSLYQFFPLLSVIVGFLVIALIHSPLGVIIAAGLYIYAYRILWLRLPCDDEEKR